MGAGGGRASATWATRCGWGPYDHIKQRQSEAAAAGNGEGEHVATPKSWKWLISQGRMKRFSSPQQIWRQRLRACMDKHVGDHVVKR